MRVPRHRASIIAIEPITMHQNASTIALPVLVPIMKNVTMKQNKTLRSGMMIFEIREFGLQRMKFKEFISQISMRD